MDLPVVRHSNGPGSAPLLEAVENQRFWGVLWCVLPRNPVGVRNS
jgi:hypothetical protein